MKHIINIQEQYGVELHTRQMIERLTASLNPEDSYLLDMQGVQQISRSAVTKGRFLPREHTAGDLPIVQCDTIGNVLQQLAAG